MPKKYTLEEVKQIFIDHKLEYLDNFYKNSQSLHKTKCKICDFQWETRLNDVKKNHGCPNCSNPGRPKHTLEEVKSLYNNRNLEFLDNYYENSRFLHLIKCKTCNYKYKIKLCQIKRKNQGCPNCSGTVKFTLDKVKKLFNDNDLEFLDNHYKNSGFPHTTKCKKCDYIWKIRLGDIIRSGCSNCAGNTKYTIEKAKDLWIKYDLEFLDDYYINSKFLHYTKCKKCEHKWRINLNTVKAGHGCPFCSLRKNEKLTIKYIEQIIGIKSSKKTIKMDCDFQKRCITDVYLKIQNQEIIIEYNGDQHYQPITFDGNKEKAQKRFEKQVKRDEWLRQYCKENNIILIEIDGRKYKNEEIKLYLIKKIINNLSKNSPISLGSC